jgi:hypothetical protein
MRNKYPDLFFRPVSCLWYMFYLSFFGSIIEATEIEDGFFFRGGGM